MSISFQEIDKIKNVAGDSFYLLNTKNFEANYNEFSKALKKNYSNAGIGYSYKTNYIPYVCKRAHILGAYAEIVSPMELEIVKGLQIPADKIIYNGPIKDAESLQYCFEGGAKVNVDNNAELDLIIRYCNQQPKKQIAIGLRLNFDLEDGEFSRFGYDVSSPDFIYLLNELKKYPQISVQGLHFHSTRKDKSPESYEKRLKKLIEVKNTIPFFHAVKYLDIGGGFYGPMDSNIKSQFDDYIPSLTEYGEVIGRAMKQAFPQEDIELIIEPGLALTVNLLDFYCRVNTVKILHGKNVVNVSGSFYNVKPSGHKRNLSVEVLKSDTRGNGIGGPYIIAGYTCLENDILYHNYSEEVLREGDFLKFSNVGAYTIVFKPPFIKLAPPILESADGVIQWIRYEEKFENTFQSYVF